MYDAVLFRGIEKDSAQKLISCLSPRVKQYAKNEIILMTGDTVRHIGIILTGSANAYISHIDGTQTLMSSFTAMSVFGEILVSIQNHKSPVTIYAASDVTAAFIEYDRVFSICSQACGAHSLFIQNLLRVISEKYFRIFDRINILREKTLREKILAYLHGLSHQKGAVMVTLPFSKTMLADYLLANRSALSKELRKMEDEGLIVVNGREVEISCKEAGLWL